MSEVVLKSENYNYENDKVLPIDFDKWLIKSRRMDYKIENKGYSVSSYKLEVRNFYYDDKIYAFEIGSGAFVVDYVLPLLVEDKGLISGYIFYLNKDMYQNFLKKYLKINLDSISKNGKIEVCRLIIDFFNDVLKLNEEYPKELGLFNQWHFTPWYTHDDVKEACKVIREFKGGDLVKMSNTKKNVLYYGCVDTYVDKSTYDFSLIKCYSLDYDERDDKALCFKFFLPPKDWQKQNGYKFEKANVDELNDKQKELYEYFKEGGFLR